MPGVIVLGSKVVTNEGLISGIHTHSKACKPLFPRDGLKKMPGRQRGGHGCRHVETWSRRGQ